MADLNVRDFVQVFFGKKNKNKTDVGLTIYRKDRGITNMVKKTVAVTMSALYMASMLTGCGGTVGNENTAEVTTTANNGDTTAVALKNEVNPLTDSVNTLKDSWNTEKDKVTKDATLEALNNAKTLLTATYTEVIDYYNQSDVTDMTKRDEFLDILNQYASICDTIIDYINSNKKDDIAFKEVLSKAEDLKKNIENWQEDVMSIGQTEVQVVNFVFSNHINEGDTLNIKIEGNTDITWQDIKVVSSNPDILVPTGKSTLKGLKPGKVTISIVKVSDNTVIYEQDVEVEAETIDTLTTDTTEVTTLKDNTSSVTTKATSISETKVSTTTTKKSNTSTTTSTTNANKNSVVTTAPTTTNSGGTKTSKTTTVTTPKTTKATTKETEPPQTTKVTTTTTTVMETEPPQTEPPATDPPTPSYPWVGMAISDFPNYIMMGYGGGNGMTVKKAWQVQQALNRIFDESLYDAEYNDLDWDMVDLSCQWWGMDRQMIIDLGITQSLTSILTIDTTYYEDGDFTPGEDDAYGGLACNTFGYMQDCGASSTAYIAILGHIQACTGRYYKMAMLVDYTRDHGFYLIATGTYDENGNELWYDGGTPEPMSFYLEGYPNAQVYYYN